MILIITHSKDLGADLVIRQLLARGQSYTRLNTDRLGTSTNFFGASLESELHLGHQVIRSSEVQAVWARRFALPDALNAVDSQYVDFVRRELSVAMDAFLDEIPDYVQINPLLADRRAGNRLLQARRAREFGFAVPRTIVTQDVAAARDFIESNEAVICKALSFGRLSSKAGAELVAYTSEVPGDVSLEGINNCPMLLQQRIPKRSDWRITTVGDRIFSARIPDASVIDWRSDLASTTQFQPAEPPPEVTERLHRLSQAGGLVYGAHDLIETPDGDFYFLETNPAGQWGWLEITAGLPIGAAIADELEARAK